MPSATLDARVARLEKLAEKLPFEKKISDGRSPKTARSFRMKSVTMAPLEGLPADLSIGTREKALACFKERHADHR